MRTIRRGVFETNSSSVHSLSIAVKGVYELWASGESFHADGEFYSFEQAKQIIMNQSYFKLQYSLSEVEIFTHQDWLDLLSDEGFMTYEDYVDRSVNTFVEDYTSPSGDELVLFGYYGYDG